MTGVFETFRRWLIAQGTLDVRMQTMLFAWAFGALLEGLVGFGYPWAFVAPILIALGLSDLDAIRVAAIANNAPVSYGALGAPIAIAQVTGYPLLAMSASVGSMVAILALLPPWVLIYLVSGREGLKDGWPLAIVGSLGYIPGQYPVAVYLEPYLPDVSGAIVCFAALLLLLSVWKPVLALRRRSLERRGAGQGAPGGGPRSRRATSAPETKTTIAAAFNCAPFVVGSAIAASWIIVAALLAAVGKLRSNQLGAIFAKTFNQTWDAFLVGIFIFGLAYLFNYSGMASSLAKGFSGLGAGFIVVAPILGFIGVALSGATHRLMRCSASSRRSSACNSACRPCCCRASIRSAPKSASRSRRKPPASASRRAVSCARRERSSATTSAGP
jgi:lactate permease